MKFLKQISNWWRISVLRKISVLDILKYANENRLECLCYSFTNACCHYNVRGGSFRQSCDKFNITEAVTFGATHGAFWWQSGDWDTGRADFLNYLIEYYSSIPPIYLEKIT